MPLLTLKERLDLYCTERKVSVGSVTAGQSEADLHQFLNNHDIPTHGVTAVAVTAKNAGLDLSNPVTHCNCAGMKAINPEDVRVLWWQHGVIDALRNQSFDEPHDVGVHYRLLTLAYLVKLGELLGPKRLAEAPTAALKLNEAYAQAKAAWLNCYALGEGRTLEDALVANGVHGDCPLHFAAMRERCSYFYKHTSF